ncbi:hypothetical protein NLJ89_g2058 [Agrocybe chaxingu]|uniref:Uncharacterized protein n=1 Tax=Agrocybe chaxingu TaxID=84603 RepID=A0A9W8K7I2_9AGAR|nr:hypothetical protein NLJ89_g2058 [Agrocybe chaxingu]
MSSPIAIPRSNKSSSASSSSSLASSPSMSSVPTTPPSPGLYVPVHKRTGSNGSHASSSRPSSPGGFHSSSGWSIILPESPSAAYPSTAEVESHSGVFTIEVLLSLRSRADDMVKEKIRADCPEVVMNRRMRKSLEFMEHQRAKADSHGHLQQEPAPTPSPATPTPTSTPVRNLPRRNRPAGRAPERRRQALQLNDNWRSMRTAPVHPLPVV